MVVAREALEQASKQAGDSAQYPWCKSCGRNVRVGSRAHGEMCPVGIAARALRSMAGEKDGM